MTSPTTPEEAAATFRCGPYACTMTGAACAAQHVRAVQTHSMRREACITCEAGKARARLLSAAPVLCRVPDGAGVECGGEPEPGRAFCRKHRAHVNIPPGPTGERVDKFVPKPPPKQREVFKPRGDATKPKPAKPKPAPKPKAPCPRAPSHNHPVACASCGWERRATGPTSTPRLQPWCGNCLWVARRSMKARGIEATPESIETWMRTPESERPAIPSKRAPCARCGTPRGHARNCHSVTEAWCTACLACARTTLYRRGVRKPTPEQVAEVMGTITMRKYTQGRGDPVAEIRAAVTRALAAGLSMDEVRAMTEDAGARARGVEAAA